MNGDEPARLEAGMRRVLRAVLGLVVIAVGMVGVWFVGGLPQWLGAPVYPIGPGGLILRFFMGLLILMVGTFAGTLIREEVDWGWTETWLQAIERRLPQKRIQLDDLAKQQQRADSKRVERWINPKRKEP